MPDLPFVRPLGLAILSLLTAAPAAAELQPPNVVFIIADDLGYGDLGCFGSSKIDTPHIDAIAERGMKLTAHYAGNAVCAPSRYVLMTGLHPGRSEVRSNREIQPEGQWPIDDATITLAERFASHGYVCGAFGKWGLGGPDTHGEPLAQGFDRFFGYNCQRIAHNFYPIALWSDRERVGLQNPSFSAYGKLGPNEDPSDPASYERFRGPDYSADLIAEQAVAFVEKNAGTPFFLFHPTTIPHLALQAPADAVARYADAPERASDYGDDPPYPGGRGYTPAFAPHATYAAMVSRMDDHVGQIVAALEANGVLDNTYIVFTSDNGPAAQGSAGTDSDWFGSRGQVNGQTLRGYKGELYEGGIRVPTVVAGPGIEPGSESDRITGFEDWTPTLLELVGGADWSTDLRSHVGDLDGVSFAPTLRGTEQSPRPPLYREFAGYGGQQAVWDGRWKAYRGKLSKQKPSEQPRDWELYDLSADPGETTDVAADHPDVVGRIDAFAADEHQPSDVFPIRVLDR